MILNLATGTATEVTYLLADEHYSSVFDTAQDIDLIVLTDTLTAQEQDALFEAEVYPVLDEIRARPKPPAPPRKPWKPAGPCNTYGFPVV